MLETLATRVAGAAARALGRDFFFWEIVVAVAAPVNSAAAAAAHMGAWRAARGRVKES